MARVSIYLNFPRTTEQAFLFYRSVFASDFSGPIHRFRDAPTDPAQPPLAEEDRDLVMHVELPIMGNCVLMGTDAPESMGFRVVQGNNVHINLEPDTRGETEHLYRELSRDGHVEMPLQDMFWGGYFASFTDRFGVCWMLNCVSRS